MLTSGKKIIATKSIFSPGFKVVLEGVRSRLKTVQGFTDQLNQANQSKSQVKIYSYLQIDSFHID